MARNTLVCHIMNELPTGLVEVGTTKTKTHSQDFTWSKRTFPIIKDSLNAIWTDKKGISHLHVFVNESDGTYYWLTPEKLNLYGFDANGRIEPLDKCNKCGGRITYDATNVRDLTKRKTINAIWGVDNSFIMLLLIMGIVLVIMMGAMFYIIGQWQQTQQTLNKYLPQATTKPILWSIGNYVN